MRIRFFPSPDYSAALFSRADAANLEPQSLHRMPLLFTGVVEQCIERGTPKGATFLPSGRRQGPAPFEHYGYQKCRDRDARILPPARRQTKPV